MRLSQINWGDDTAEKDPNLLQYFVSSDSLSRLTKREKGLVIGRKGSGKSALRKKLQEVFESEKGTTVVNIAPKYSSIRNVLNEQDLAQGFGEEIFFQYTWVRQILKDCLCAYGSRLSGQLTTGYDDFARKLALECLATPADLVENVVEVLKRIKVKAGKLGDLGLSLESELRAASGIDALEHNFSGVANKGTRFVILIDDLDLGWDNSQLSNRLLLGLLSAYTHLGTLHANIFICVFLREDVYNILMSQSPQSDKYRNIERLRWDTAKLTVLLSERINFARKAHGLLPLDDAFHSVFSETTSTSNTDNWLVERTLSRPRELIQLSRYYTESVETELPDAEKLKEAEGTYSAWKLSDLATEYINQYPKLDTIFSLWTTRFFRRKYTLTRSEIDQMLLELLVEAPINETWFNRLVDQTDTLGFLNILYEIGFIGDYFKGGDKGSKSLYSFAHQHKPSFDEVQIHPCFRKAVGTVERIRSKEVGPSAQDSTDSEN